MPEIPMNPGILRWAAETDEGKVSGSFRPHGPFVIIGDRASRNPEGWFSKKTLSARIIVGFNIGKNPYWSMEDVIEMVKQVRIEQEHSPNASFIAQKGLYRHKDPKEGDIEEDGAQIMIIDEDGLNQVDFKDEMVHLAEIVATAFLQDSVILEIQQNGLTLGTRGIYPLG
jgi:hypothetical protein